MPRSMKPGDVQTLRYWHRSKEPPPGWEHAASFEGCHHGERGKLIREKGDAMKKPGEGANER